MVVVIRAAEQIRIRDHHHRAEDDTCDHQVRRSGHVYRDRAGTHQAAEDRADRPHRVERVDYRAAVVALHAKAVRVLGDIGDRVRGPRGEQRGGEHDRRSGQAGDDHERCDADGADHRDARRVKPPDQRRGGEPRNQRAAGERCDRRAVHRIGQVQVGLDLRIARQQVGEQRPVGQK